MKPIDDGSSNLPKYQGSSIKRMGRDDDDDDDRPVGGRSSRNDKPKGGISTIAIVGMVIGGLLLSCCVCCGGWTALNWTEFKKGFDQGFQKAQQPNRK